MATEMGHYSVNGKLFKSKIEAILYANTTKADVDWYFYNDVYSALNWSVEPTTSLQEFYKIRASQIREEYDYIIIMYSGGADSTNVVYSFIDNGLLVDEVIAGAPLSGLSNFQWDDKDRSAGNMISETKFTQLPGLEQIKQADTRIKITIHDYFEDMANIEGDEWLYNRNLSHWCNPSVFRHWLDKFDHIKKIIEQGKKVGIVYGIDKPIVCKGESGSLYCTIPDGSVNFISDHFPESYPNVDTVLFYFTPKLPQMLVKQAHEIFRFLYDKKNSFIKDNYLWDRAKLDPNPSLRASNYQRAIVPTIYPSTYKKMLGKFQSHKPSLGFQGNIDLDSWAYDLHQSSKFIEIWKSDFTRFLKNIDKKYLNDIYGFKPIYVYWKIGDESMFNKDIEYRDNLHLF